MANTHTIAKNSAWYGIETAIGFAVTIFTSVAIARTLGPSKMGYIIYVTWIASIVSSLGALGVPATTRKYMAEFLGAGDKGTARHIYFRTLLMQAGLATVVTSGLLFWVLRDAGSGYALASGLIALSIWPSMVNSISAQANVAAEELSANLPASVASILVFFVAIACTVVFRWGVVGVGAAMLLMRMVDFLVRFLPTARRISLWPQVRSDQSRLGQRMTIFAWQSVATMVVALIVWDRSEFFLLKHLCSDIRQVAYYSVAFSMAERLLISASVFSSATGATIFAQYGRDKSKLSAIVASAFRYLFLTSVPLHAIASALATPALMLLYGNQYKDAAAVVTLAPLLCLPKAFIDPIQNLLQSSERQGHVILATVIAGIADLSVAWYLIPAHGAVGACIGSGVAQVVALGILWAIGIHDYGVKLPWLCIAKVAVASSIASLAAHFIAIQCSPVWGIVLGGSTSVAVVILLFRGLHVLDATDRDRFALLTVKLPKRLAVPVDATLLFLTGPPDKPYQNLESLQQTVVNGE